MSEACQDGAAVLAVCVNTLLVIAGPTSAGKTAASLAIAERWGAVILSVDAMQVYRGMNIGTGKVSEAIRQQVPHFAIDVRDPGEPFDVADLLKVADELLKDGRRVLAVGGTHLYVHSLRKGLVEIPEIPSEVRGRFKEQPDVYEQLLKVDEPLALRLHRNDRLRLIRGLEVFHGTGLQLSKLQDDHKKEPDSRSVHGVWIDRDDLDERINQRVHQMMDEGYLQEVESLLNLGVSPTCKPMKSLGYRHLASHLLKGLPLDECVRLTQRDTRRFARKQRTWRKRLTTLLDVAPSNAINTLQTLAVQHWGESKAGV